MNRSDHDVIHGVAAEFDRPEAVAEAVRSLKARGYTRIDVYSPFPLADVAEQLDVRTGAIPWIVLIAGIAGALVQYGAQYWMNVIDYPLNVGGRPLHSWPAFLPTALIVAVLWAGVAALLGLLIILRLPRLHHPMFAVPAFARASQDRFFLCLSANDPRFDGAEIHRLLLALGPVAVYEVPR